MKFKVWIEKDTRVVTLYLTADNLTEYENELKRLLKDKYIGWKFQSCWGGE